MLDLKGEYCNAAPKHGDKCLHCGARIVAVSIKWECDKFRILLSVLLSVLFLLEVVEVVDLLLVVFVVVDRKRRLIMMDFDAISFDYLISFEDGTKLYSNYDQTFVPTGVSHLLLAMVGSLLLMCVLKRFAHTLIKVWTPWFNTSKYGLQPRCTGNSQSCTEYGPHIGIPSAWCYNSCMQENTHKAKPCGSS